MLKLIGKKTFTFFTLKIAIYLNLWSELAKFHVLAQLKCMFMLFNILLYSQIKFRYGLILFSQIIYPSG